MTQAFEIIGKARVLVQDAKAIELANRAQELYEQVPYIRDYPIRSEQDVADLTRGAREFAATLDAVEEERKSITRPIREDEKLVNEAYRPYTTALNAMLAAIKGRIARYQTELQAEQRRLQAAAVESFKAGAPERGVALMAQVPLAVETPGVSVRDRWTFEVTDPDAVPRELCSPDPAKLAAFVKAYPKEATYLGFRVFAAQQVTVRR